MTGPDLLTSPEMSDQHACSSPMFPASQLETQNSQSSSDELLLHDQHLHAHLETCSSLAGPTSRTFSPKRQEIRRLASPLSKEQLIDLIAHAAAISPAVQKLVQATANASPAARRIMVRNIHYNTTESAFMNHFADYGPLEDAAIVREKCGRSKGFGFVTFKNIESMHGCLSSTLHLDGRKLFVKVAADPFSEFLSDGAPIQGRMTRRKIFIRNLPTNCDAAELREAFSQYGPIEDCAVVADARGRPRGFAFITYATQEGAVKASAEPQQTFAGRVIFVSIAKSCTRQPIKNRASTCGVPKMMNAGENRTNVLFDPWTDSTSESIIDLINCNNRYSGEKSASPFDAAARLAAASFIGQYKPESIPPYGLYPYSTAAAVAAYNLIAAQGSQEFSSIIS